MARGLARRGARPAPAGRSHGPAGDAARAGIQSRLPRAAPGRPRHDVRRRDRQGGSHAGRPSSGRIAAVPHGPPRRRGMHCPRPADRRSGRGTGRDSPGVALVLGQPARSALAPRLQRMLDRDVAYRARRLADHGVARCSTSSTPTCATTRGQWRSTGDGGPVDSSGMCRVQDSCSCPVPSPGRARGRSSTRRGSPPSSIRPAGSPICGAPDPLRRHGRSPGCSVPPGATPGRSRRAGRHDDAGAPARDGGQRGLAAPACAAGRGAADRPARPSSRPLPPHRARDRALHRAGADCALDR